MTEPVRISHIIYRLAMGGMENGLINLVNGMDSRFKHQIISLTDASDFQNRIKNPNVTVTMLNKQPGKDFGFYARLFKTLRGFKPDIVHTRNFGTVDCAVIAKLATRAKIVHSEHGWDMGDLDGSNQRYIRMRRWMSHFAVRYLAVSADIKNWLAKTVGVAQQKLIQIYNGVDADKFHPRSIATECKNLSNSDAQLRTPLVVGFVGRIESVKNPQSLVKALHFCLRNPTLERPIKVCFVGSGSQQTALEASAKQWGVHDSVEFLGARKDVADLMRSFDVFVLPSYNEGISNTILEAMACGLPVIAADVGGNPELIIAGETGMLYPSDDAQSLASMLLAYANDDSLRKQHGAAARQRIEQFFTLDSMILSYQQMYQSILADFVREA